LAGAGVSRSEVRELGLTVRRDTRTLKATLSVGVISMTKFITTPIVIPEAVRRKAGLRRGEKVEFRVSGRAITIVPEESSREDYPMETIMRIIREAKRRPMSRAEGEAVDAGLMAYGAQQPKKAGIKERDITRIIHESRARRRRP
jgi:bifunctional DNA-binding transcriptional regulator/antitoxin component of YhaV-PrlF toxin-antitoxin module